MYYQKIFCGTSTITITQQATTQSQINTKIREGSGMLAYVQVK